MTKRSKTSRESGFTLVELSIVLVIIGLILAGVLVGQDLIKAAQVRSAVSQLQQLDAALNTFNAKYEGYPGDLRRAIQFGICTPVGCAGDGDGQFTDSMPADAVVQWDTELPYVWQHMSSAGLLAGSYDGVGSTIGEDFPPTKFNIGGVTAVTVATVNYWAYGAADGAVNFTAGLSPTEAFGMDSKLDDGKPITGLMTAHAGSAGIIEVYGAATPYVGAGIPTSTDTAGMVGCVLDPDMALGTGNDEEYNLADETKGCPLRVRISG